MMDTPARPRREVRQIAPDELRTATQQLRSGGFRLALVAGHDEGPVLRVVYVFLAGAPDRRTEVVVRVPAASPVVPSLAEISYPAGRFERELHDLFGVVPQGHPLPRRLVRHAHWPAGWYPMRRDAGDPPPFTAGDRFPFLRVDGDGVYEIPVGPVHAGLIEPGHFRFSVVGESILKLKARLWFVHRGVEKLFQDKPDGDGVPLAERISGDTSVGHALAHCLAVEDALGVAVPPPAQQLRSLLLELERLYNHAADLGALANDVGFGLANAHAQLIREELLRINEAVTGQRLLRGAIRPGGVALRSLPDPSALAALAADLDDVARLTLSNSVIKDRFAGTAVLDPADAMGLGCLGPVARASGMPVDARIDHPIVGLPVRAATRTSGDVLARYEVRRDEFAASVDLIAELVAGHRGPLDPAVGWPVAAAATGDRPDGPGIRSGLGIAEGWRGTIVHRVEIDANRRISRAKIVDPSWLNWPALPVAMADTIVPDFPLANKSFNLSYAGNDL